MSDAGSSDDEDFDFKEVAAPSDGDEAVDEESLSSALKLLSGPSAAEVAEEQALLGPRLDWVDAPATDEMEH